METTRTDAIASTWLMSFGHSAPPPDSRRIAAVEPEIKKPRKNREADKSKMLVRSRPGKKLRRGIFALLRQGIDYLIGHNIDFDWVAIGKPEVKRICTLALSRYLWPELDSHNQSSMLYFLERESARDLLQGKAHSALDDVKNCAILLNHIIPEIGGIDSWETLWHRSEIARIPQLMPFGKHKGVPIKDIPSDYKRWLLGQPDIDQYLIKALKTS